MTFFSVCDQTQK